MRRLIAALILAAASASARAVDAIRDPLAYPLRHYLVVLGMTLIGGFAGWYVKVRRGEVLASSLFALVGEMTISALAGLGTFFACDYAAVPIGITAAASGIAGYMGGRAIDLLEALLLRRAGITPTRRAGDVSRPAPLDGDSK